MCVPEELGSGRCAAYSFINIRCLPFSLVNLTMNDYCPQNKNAWFKDEEDGNTTVSHVTSDESRRDTSPKGSERCTACLLIDEAPSLPAHVSPRSDERLSANENGTDRARAAGR